MRARVAGSLRRLAQNARKRKCDARQLFLAGLKPRPSKAEPGPQNLKATALRKPNGGLVWVRGAGKSKRGPSLLRRDKSSAREKRARLCPFLRQGKRDDNVNRSGKKATAKAPTLRRGGEEWGARQSKYKGNGKSKWPG